MNANFSGTTFLFSIFLKSDLTEFSRSSKVSVNELFLYSDGYGETDSLRSDYFCNLNFRSPLPIIAKCIILDE